MSRRTYDHTAMEDLRLRAFMAIHKGSEDWELIRDLAALVFAEESAGLGLEGRGRISEEGLTVSYDDAARKLPSSLNVRRGGSSV